MNRSQIQRKEIKKTFPVEVIIETEYLIFCSIGCNHILQINGLAKEVAANDFRCSYYEKYLNRGEIEEENNQPIRSPCLKQLRIIKCIKDFGV